MCRFVRFRFFWLKHTLESAAFRKNYPRRGKSVSARARLCPSLPVEMTTGSLASSRCRAMSMPV